MTSNLNNKNSLKIVFAGTPDFAASILKALIAAEHNIAAVYCQPDRRVGRGKKVVFGPVKQLALENVIPVEQPEKFGQEINEQGQTAQSILKSYNADLLIVVAYGLLLPENILSIPKFGCINVHASLLPKWRGAAPIQRSIQYGDKETGITIMQMDKGLDTGNMLCKEKCEILDDETGASLHDKLAMVGGSLLVLYLQTQFTSNSMPNKGEIQAHALATYAHKLTKAEAAIDWLESAIEIERKIRAFNAWPVSYTYLGPNRLRIWKAQVAPTPTQVKAHKPGQIIEFDKAGILVKCCNQQSLLIQQIQADGSRKMTVLELLNSKRQWFIDNPQFGNCQRSDPPFQ